MTLDEMIIRARESANKLLGDMKEMNAGFKERHPDAPEPLLSDDDFIEAECKIFVELMLRREREDSDLARAIVMAGGMPPSLSFGFKRYLVTIDEARHPESTPQTITRALHKAGAIVENNLASIGILVVLIRDEDMERVKKLDGVRAVEENKEVRTA